MNQPLGTHLSPRDSLLHQPPINEMTWLETNGISWFVPELQMRSHMPVKFRTNVGVVYSTIMVWSKECADYNDFDYIDARVHLPMPRQNMDHYTLANGLTVKMTEPLKRYEVTYEGFNGTRIEFELTGLMPAVDSKETVVQGGKDFSHFYPIKSMLKDSVGHVDQTMMVNGVFVNNGKEIKIHGPSMFDHSWGPRPEYGHAAGTYDEGYFGADGTDLMFHVQTLNESPEQGRIQNGYIIDGGELLRIKEGSARHRFEGWVLRETVYEIEDERGRTFTFTGAAKTPSRLPTLPNQWIMASFCDWTVDGDRSDRGYGESKWHWEISDMVGTKGFADRPSTRTRNA